MGNWRRFAGLLVILATVVACAAPDSGQRQGVNQGSLARDFTLETLDGTKVSLKDQAGKVVLINFWATWCPPCTAEMPDIQATYEAYQDQGFVVLGVNVEESREAVEPFVRSLGVTYPVLLDESGRVMEMYRGLGLPMSLLVDPEGVIQVRHIGYLTAAQLERYVAELLP